MDLNKKTLDRLKTDPLHHVTEVQGVTTMEEFQIKILESVAKNERTVVAACHDVGKTFTASKIVLWFTSVFEGAKVVTTAPTLNQVKLLLWSEIRTGFNKSKFPLGGEIGLTQWKIQDDWFAVGYTSKSEAGSGQEQGAASSFQGVHAPYILVIFDEATGINASIWVQMEGLMTSSMVRFLAIGNPTTKSCEFFKCFSDPAYEKIYLSCFDSPNFVANQIRNKTDLRKEFDRVREISQLEQQDELTKYKIVNTHLLTVRWVMRMILKLGMEHPLVKSKCFGEFPDQDDLSLISLGVVQKAQFRICKTKPEDRDSIGVDVARYGSDKTVITHLKGTKQVLKKTLIKRGSEQIAGEIIQIVKDSKGFDIHIAIDGTGVGSGVVDMLRKAQREGFIPQKAEIRECHFGGGPGGKKGSKKETELKQKYLNLKARIYVELAEDLANEIDLLDSEDVYQEELPTIHYHFDSKGRYCIESKDEYQARTGRSSPDDSDSLALANFARHDGSGVGTFTETLNKTSNAATIVSYSKGTDQW